ncbi:MAG: hypothetical protein RLZZ246_1324, partial [Planctomycetota bacterium]
MTVRAASPDEKCSGSAKHLATLRST